MGYMSHHAIVVTSWNEKAIEEARNKAVEIFTDSTQRVHVETLPIGEILISPTNGYRSFFIPPDGSKEGWDSSDIGDERREAFKDWLNKQAYEDGSTSLDWVEINFGGDGALDGRESITDSSMQFMETSDWEDLQVG